MFGFSFGQILFVVLLVGAAAYLGLMLGRRSKTANAAADLIKAQIEDVKARTRVALKEAGLD